MAKKSKSKNMQDPALRLGPRTSPITGTFFMPHPVRHLQKLPAQVDLRPQCPKEVYDQGQLGSCTANSIAGAIEFDQIKLKLRPAFTPSRLFIYYNERVIEGTVELRLGLPRSATASRAWRPGCAPRDHSGRTTSPSSRQARPTADYIDGREIHGRPLSAVGPDREPDEGLSRLGLSLRFRVHGL